MPKKSSQLSIRKIFFFWIPLASTWLMMAAEGPFLAAVIARLQDPKHNLAAYGVAFSFAILIEAPIIMITSASTALVKDKSSYFKLRNFIWFVMRTAPFLWIILSVLTLVFGLLAFQKTRHGYRYQTLFVASLIVLAILILGVMTHFLKINNRFENFSRGIPRYKNLAHPKEFRWLKPEEGLLAGEIIKLKSNGVVIINFKGEEWSVDYGNETIIDPRVELAEKEQIRIIGEKIGNFCFKAQIIKKMNRTIMHSPQKFR